MATAVATQTETMTSRPQTQKSKITFGDLSEELQALVIERVTRPSDLKRICLVSKQLHQLAARCLYRNVALDLGSDNDNRLSAFLSSRNIGLKYVRQLRLYLAEAADKCNQEKQAQFAARMVLEFLPEDILEEFSWCPWRPFSTDNLLLLYKRQRKMRWLEVMDLDRAVLPELKKLPKLQASMFQSAKKLALYPENRDTLTLSGYYVEKCKDQLEELIVHCNFNDLSSSVPDSRELNDSATGPGLLSRTIFSCMMPFEECLPFQNLKSLRLHRISLRYCVDSWCHYIDFQKLEYLRLYHCSGADTLLGQMCKSKHLPKSLKVLELQHRDNSENEALIALDGFLCLTSGVRNLVIDFENVKAMPAAAGIVRHGKTLEVLNVHCAQEGHPTSLSSPDCDSEELVWSTEDFERICKACNDLEQLSCAWPATSLIRAPSDEWKSYESSCGNLKRMITLHITTWPSNKPSTQLLPRSVYESLLQALAQRGFEMAAGMTPLPSSYSTHNDSENTVAEFPLDVSEVQPTKLRLIAFGVSDRIYERSDSKNQLIYLRSSCHDADGNARPYAAPMSWCMRQFVEPRSEVLDFVLHRSHDRDFHPPMSDYSPGRLQRGGGWGAVADEDE